MRSPKRPSLVPALVFAVLLLVVALDGVLTLKDSIILAAATLLALSLYRIEEG